MESNDVVENPIENSKEPQDTNETETDENFEKFIYELFEKNGVLNDLRAYLRGHIVDVLKKAQTGDTPACQKNFTQRLDLTYQALNMLVAEYLLSMDFNYSLSVFLSEIPLANMVFDYSRSLLHNNPDNSNLRFKESDVWSILNYLSIKCDSEHALNIIKMYNGDERVPLMLCLLKCMPMYKYENHETAVEQDNSTTVSMCSSICSNIIADDTKSFHKTQSQREREKCKHYAVCKPCQQKYKKAKEHYKEKKQNISKDETKQALFNIVHSKSFIKDISIIEQDLINEMFEELKSVYEAEVVMAKAVEEKRVKKSLVSHALQLKKHRDEMEETFKQREAELERSVTQKKQFLWGLARALRDQHASLARAVRAVRQETRRLSDKEEGLKSQLLEAERIMAKRGEEMRAQISEELAILEAHLDSMKKERDSINKERSHLEQLKVVCECSSNVVKANTTEVREDLRSHYDLLKNELGILKKFLDSSNLQARCVIERSTMTEIGEDASKTTIVLNNEQETERCPGYVREEDRCARTPNQLVNDFKKQKNVNFDQVMQSAEDMFRPTEPAPLADDGEAELSRQRDVIALLTAENMRLRDHAQQYREQMEELARLQARLRVRTSPPPAPAAATPAQSFSAHLHRTPSSSRGGLNVANGAGEQLSALIPGRPRVLLPTDAVPFIGSLAADTKEHRRHLLSQWRALRKRASLTNDTQLPRPRPSSAGATANSPPHEPESDPSHRYSFEPARESTAGRAKTPLVLDTPRQREKSPKTVLKEVKGKLRNKNSVKGAPVKREKSPNSVLREAKLRLRKLEIEAEAVEKSYLDFRKRQSELRDDRQGYAEDGKPYAAANEEAVVTKDIGSLDIRHSSPVQSSLPPNRLETHTTKSYYNESQAMKDFDKYLREYHTKLDFGEKYLQVHTLSAAAKPIPETFSEIHKEPINVRRCENFNYLETPLTEFRKLYQTDKPSNSCKIIDSARSARSDRTRSEIINNLENINDANDLENIHDATKLMEDSVNHEQFEAIKNALLKEKTSKKAELEILRSNINKIYDLKDTPATLTPDKNSLGDRVSKGEASKVDMVKQSNNHSEQSKLRIEIETVSQTNTMKVTNSEPENVMVLVESSVVATKLAASESEGDARNICPNMTILISPKKSIDNVGESEASLAQTSERSKRSLSPEQAALLTRNDVFDAIFHGDPLKESTQSLQQEPEGREASISEIGKYPPDEYPDDFSADVDNYNTRNSSPISLPKTDDDSFW